MSSLRCRLSLALAFGLPLAPLAAGQIDTVSGDVRNFVFVHDKTVAVNGSWSAASQLQTYAHTHPGRYIVFEQKGALYRLEDPRALDEVEKIYAPMAALDAQQKELGEQGKPLAEQQRLLAAQQKAAVGNPAEQGRIGAEQGRIGRQQGELGSKQGEIGRQQGAIGRAFYTRVLSLIDACLAANTCRQVPS